MTFKTCQFACAPSLRAFTTLFLMRGQAGTPALKRRNMRGSRPGSRADRAKPAPAPAPAKPVFAGICTGGTRDPRVPGTWGTALSEVLGARDLHSGVASKLGHTEVLCLGWAH